jgi:SAM-dependent methyltransferase
MDRIYREVPLQTIPWNSENPPEILVDLVGSGKVKPCRAIDLGCGAGNYALFLAGAGFDMTGVDISSRAIEIARENAAMRGIRCTFLVTDLLGDLHEIRDTYEFAYDWEVLHHIFPEDRERYVSNIHRILRPGGKYLSVCFSDEDPQFGGSGKYRKTPLGTTLYFSSERELRELFRPFFTVRSLETREVPGKYGPHLAICAFLEKH